MSLLSAMHAGSAGGPSGPNIDSLRKRAKALLKLARSGDASALDRIRSAAGATDTFGTALPRLADGLHAVAREHGFPSWPKLKAYADSLTGERASRLRPIELDPAWFRDRAAGLVSQFQSRLPEAAERQIGRLHPRFAGQSADAIFAAGFTLDDALLVTAREHGFASWADLTRHLAALSTGKAIEPFYLAFAAMKAGDMQGLGDWLDNDASLIAARGSNGNTLLNLASGTGNLDAVRLLIERRADVEAENVRGWTPLHSASSHLAIIRLLLDAGARADRFALGDGGTPLVMAQFWGKRKAADVLAGERGILPRNLRAAGGAGARDLIAELIDARGRLAPEAGDHRAFYRPHSGFPVWMPSSDPQEIVDEALTYAARNLRFDAIDMLLERGARIDADPYRGTPLIWVASLYPPDPEDARLQLLGASHLLDRGADVNRVGTFGGPTHGEGITALHLAAQANNRPLVDLLLGRGANPTVRDRIYNSTPEGWASHFGHEELANAICLAAADTADMTRD